MIELKKRVFVMLNATITTFQSSDRYHRLDTINHVKRILKGEHLDYRWSSVQAWIETLLKEVRTIMYLTEISTEDMIQVLDDLESYWR